MTKILFQGDDFGFTRGVTLGIVDSIDRGVLRNTGLFANTPSAEFAVSFMKDRPQACFGIDFNLVAGPCVSDPAEIPHLVDEKGNFIKPTIFADVTNDMRIAQEEIFGPVVCILPFETEDEVIAMANDSEYGLGGAVWTRDINRALRVAKGVETGRMWVNTYNALPAGAPFGGYKLSGIGRETDKTTMRHYMQTKNICINLSEKPSGLYE